MLFCSLKSFSVSESLTFKPAEIQYIIYCITSCRNFPESVFLITEQLYVHIREE